MEGLLRIVAPHFVAGLVVAGCEVSETAPILRYMLDWPIWEVIDYCDRKGWKVE